MAENLTTYPDSISKDLEHNEVQQLMLDKLSWRKFVYIEQMENFLKEHLHQIYYVNYKFMNEGYNK